MLNEQEKLQLWKNKATEDQDLVNELSTLNNEDEIYERFFCDLSFGTAGLRGILSAGTNRMNIYTVRRATQGLANYLKANFERPSVVIAFDSRIKSEIFAKEAARVLCANEVDVFFNKELQPTPVLSFCVRECGCKAGIMITASHNPATYNGYKCYGPDGCQISGTVADAVYEEMRQLDMFDGIKICDFEEALVAGKIKFLQEELYRKYLECVLEQRVSKEIDSTLKVVYTPLNGTGNKLVRKALKEIGIQNVTVVAEQELPDGNFKTCPYPNPEMPEALTLALKIGEDINADLVLATDPDCDRVGMAFRNEGIFKVLTGNEIGILLLYYILTTKKNLPETPVVVKTLVSSKLADTIAKDFGCEVRNVLTGFKYIGEQIFKLEQQGQEARFLFGFEESLGFLTGSYVRDKDAVLGAMLICEMAAYYKKQGKDLSEVLMEIYFKYGFFKHHTLSFEFAGVDGARKMQEIKQQLRQQSLEKISGIKVLKRVDLLKGEIQGLPKADVLMLELEFGNRVIVRPSGTEPKIKVYLTTQGSTDWICQALLEKLLHGVRKLFNSENKMLE